MYTVNQVFTRKQLNALFAKLKEAGCKITERGSTIALAQTPDQVVSGGFCVSAASRTGSKWSVQVSMNVAKAHGLPLWSQDAEAQRLADSAK